MLSKTKIKQRTREKTNSELVETIQSSGKGKSWEEVRTILASPTRRHASVNLKKIDANTSQGETVVVPGRVLGEGNVTKKIRICALGFSESAKEKLKESKSEMVSILEEVKKNPKGEGIKIIK